MKKNSKLLWLIITTIITVILIVAYLVSHNVIKGEQEVFLDRNQLNTVNSIIINETNSIKKESLIVEYLSDILKIENDTILNHFVSTYGIEHLPSILTTYSFKTKSYFWLTDPKILLEVIFWSLFGLLSNLLYSVTTTKKFDKRRIPEHIGKFFYTPFLTLIIFFSINALIDSNSVSVDGIGRNAIVLSFVLGFFTRRAIVLLGKLKDLILPIGKKELENNPDRNNVYSGKIEGVVSIGKLSEEVQEQNVEYTAVKISSLNSEFTSVTNPDKDGFFSFDNIPIGKYVIEAELVIETTRYFEQNEIQIDGDEDVKELNFNLKPAELILK